jgi:hypothetical protein
MLHPHLKKGYNDLELGDAHRNQPLLDGLHDGLQSDPNGIVGLRNSIARHYNSKSM